LEDFFFNGLLYKVVESSANGCFCVCIKDGTKTSNLSKSEAAAIIERQNNKIKFNFLLNILNLLVALKPLIL
jgi:hypothetical protein